MVWPHHDDHDHDHEDGDDGGDPEDPSSGTRTHNRSIAAESALQHYHQQGSGGAYPHPPPYHNHHEAAYHHGYHPAHDYAAAGPPPHHHHHHAPPPHHHYPGHPWGGGSAAAAEADAAQPMEEDHHSAAGDHHEDSDSDEGEVEEPIKPRGKPQALAAALAAKQVEAKRQELREEEEAQQAHADDDDDDAMEVEATAAPVVPTGKVAKKSSSSSASGGVLATASTPAAPPKKKKSTKTSPTKKKGGPGSGSKSSPTRKTKQGSRLPLANRGSKMAGGGGAGGYNRGQRTECLLGEHAPKLSDQEYSNLQELMVQFCKVPLLAEFSRPVALLHPELSALYKKIVSHPVDLGHVCRGIRRKQYKYARDLRLDMWRVFSNCILFHSHPHNKEAVPSFVSIALHLREYFNTLWQEYMLPSDLPPKLTDDDDDDDEDVSELIQHAFTKRSEDRQKRMENSGILVMSKNFTTKTAALLHEFIVKGGCVDDLDRYAVIGTHATIQDRDLPTVVDNLKTLQAKLEQLAEQATTTADEYSLDEFHQDLKNSYTLDVLEDNPALRNQIGNRIDRFFWKRAIPLHEANSRGVTQSSIWGNVAATIWARESSKKAYWPALCLGILPPEDQREGWHAAVTERNESRLPEKIRAPLLQAKRKSEQAQKRQNLSYFLVEFLGTHEFIWVRETDIIEKFDRNEDPNKAAPSKSKKRASRSHISALVGSKTYAMALEECEWACEEYEAILQGAFDEDSDVEEADDDGDLNYNFSVLCQSDDEADEADEHGYEYDEDLMSETEAEEANLLLAHDGMVDPGTTSGTKKKASKKKGASSSSATKKKSEKGKRDRVAESARKEKKAELEKRRTKAREEKKELKELEKRRKKRTRDREKALRDEAKRQAKRTRTDSVTDGADESHRRAADLSRDKRARATAIVKNYLVRTGKSKTFNSSTDNNNNNEQQDYRSLAHNGVMAMPAAMVDPTGLLGMALAFRAAAGVIHMPDASEERIRKTTKPWTAIDTKRPITSAERCENLEKQIEMMEKELQIRKRNIRTRRDLAKRAIEERAVIDRDVETDDIAARLNHFNRKRRKTMSPKPAATNKAATAAAASDKAESKGGDDEDDEDDENDDDGIDDGDDATPVVVSAPMEDHDEEATGGDDSTAAAAAAEPVSVVVEAAVDGDDGNDEDDVPMTDIEVAHPTSTAAE